MARMLLTLSLLFLAFPCFASGKLTVKPAYVLDDGRVKYDIGLAVYEKLRKDLYYNGWFGGGEYDHYLGKQWYKTGQGVETLYGPLKLGVGASYQYNPQTHFDEKQIFSDLSVKLW